MLPCRFSDVYHLRRISQEGRTLEGFVWEEGVFPSSHAPVNIDTKSFHFSKFSNRYKILSLHFASPTLTLLVTVSPNLFKTSNLIGSCWSEALLFQRWVSLLVLFVLVLSIVFSLNPVSRSNSFRSTQLFLFCWLDYRY